MTTSKDEHSVRSKEPSRQLIIDQTKAFLDSGKSIIYCTKGQGVNPPAYRAFT